METGKVLFVYHDNAYILKLLGSLRFENSSGLSNILKKLNGSSAFNAFLVDMRKTTFVDSTVLGMLAQCGKWAQDKGVRPIIIYHDDDLKKIISTVGLQQLFDISKESIISDDKINFTELMPKSGSHTVERTDVLKAHKVLSELDAGNKDEFENVINCFEKGKN